MICGATPPRAPGISHTCWSQQRQSWPLGCSSQVIAPSQAATSSLPAPLLLGRPPSLPLLTPFRLPAGPSLLLGSACPLCAFSRKPSLTTPVRGYPCLPQHVAQIKLGFDYVLDHCLQSILRFIRHFSRPRSHWNLTRTLRGQMVLGPVLQMGTQEVRKRSELMWGCDCTMANIY